MDGSKRQPAPWRLIKSSNEECIFTPIIDDSMSMSSNAALQAILAMRLKTGGVMESVTVSDVSANFASTEAVDVSMNRFSMPQTSGPSER